MILFNMEQNLKHLQNMKLKENQYNYKNNLHYYDL